MTNEDMLRRLLQPSVVPVQVPRVPTDAEKTDIERVERMQVRTQAGVFATQLLAGRSPDPNEWVDLAKAVELFIWGKV